MANHFWDLGFDFNSVLNRNFEHLLANGFVLTTPSTDGSRLANVPATPMGIAKGDTITFNVFNITANLQGSYRITGGEIGFTNAVAQRDEGGQMITSPFNNPDGSYLVNIPIEAMLEPTSTGPSTIFSGVQAPEALASPPPSNLAVFPVYTIPGLIGLTVNNEGRFLVNFKLTCEGPSGQMIFLDDPEMIVGTGGTQ